MLPNIAKIDEQKKEIDQQRAALSALKATYARRHITDDQKQILIQVAKSSPNPQYSLRLFEPNNCTDCDEYGGEFAELFTGADMGWKLSQFEQVFGGINPKFRGLAILVKDKEKPSKAALVLAQTFKEAKIEFVANVANGMLRLSDDEAGLVIGPKN